MRVIDITLSDEGNIESVDWVAWIMKEIEGEGFTRKDVANTYAKLIRRGHKDFKAINETILKRWSKSALRWIKEQAWKQVHAAEREARAWAKYGGCSCMGHGECNFCKER